jgi:hypothetical protein
LVEGLSEWLRTVAKQNGFYDNRRPFQIIASIAVVLIVVVLLVYGLISIRHHIKRHRLAVAFAALVVGFGTIRFISLHEVDAWNAAMPWARRAVELIVAGGVSAAAIARLRQLGEFARLVARQPRVDRQAPTSRRLLYRKRCPGGEPRA